MYHLNALPPQKVNSGVIRIIPDANKRALIESMDTLGAPGSSGI